MRFSTEQIKKLFTFYHGQLSFKTIGHPKWAVTNKLRNEHYTFRSIHCFSGLLRTIKPPKQVSFSMEVQEQIKEYIAGQPETKRADMEELDRIIIGIMPGCKIWFLDGKNSEGKTVSNPNMGYGIQTMKYADGKTREFYQIGMSANTTGISVYILGIEDKKYLAETYGKDLGKASVSGYCIKFKALKDIKIEVLEAAIRYGIAQSR